MDNKPLSPYQVGYKKPPAETKFKKGKSGNPKGRPRGSKTKVPLSLGDERLKALLLEEAYRTIPINEAGKSVTMPMAQAVIRSVAVSAAKGHTRAQKLFLEAVRAIEDEHYKSLIEYNHALMNYKFEWEEAIQTAIQHGQPIPDPVPHPRDIHVNYRTGVVTVNGPFSLEERQKWDKLRAQKKDFLEVIEEYKADLADPKCEYKSIIQDELDHCQKIVAIISRVIKD